jgi:hypothetical protein
MHFTKTLLYCIVILATNTIFAQTTIDNIQTGYYIQVGLEANSRLQYAGVSFPFSGMGASPNVSAHLKNGLYIGAQANLFTDKTITKKTKLPELDVTVGFNKKNEIWDVDINLTHTKINYGNKFFRRLLNNCVNTNVTYSPTDNIDVEANVDIMFGKPWSYNKAMVFAIQPSYTLYFDDALQAEQTTLGIGIASYAGSTKLISVSTELDNITAKSKTLLKENSPLLMPVGNATPAKFY